ncbi:MAG TPA: response regulator transcription factor [Pseudomonadales bacterium]
MDQDAGPGLLIIDDHPMFREGLEGALRRLAPAARVVHAGSIAEARGCLEAHRDLDAVLLDVQLGDEDGLELMPLIRDQVPDAGVLIISGTRTALLAARALEQGAHGFISKAESDVAELPAALEAVLRRELYLPEDLKPQVLDARGRLRITCPLSPREREVLQAQLAGLNIDEVAERLQIAPSTVKAHNRNIQRSWGLSRMTKVLAAARDLGILPAPVRSR